MSPGSVPFDHGTFTATMALWYPDGDKPLFRRSDQGGEKIITFGYKKWKIRAGGAGEWPKVPPSRPDNYRFGIVQTMESLRYEVTYTRVSGASGTPNSWKQHKAFNDQRIDMRGDAEFPWLMQGAWNNMGTLSAQGVSVSVIAEAWDQPQFEKKIYVKNSSNQIIGRLTGATLNAICRTYVVITDFTKRPSERGNLVAGRCFVHNLSVRWATDVSTTTGELYQTADPVDKTKTAEYVGSGPKAPTSKESPTAQDGLAGAWTPPVP